MRAGSVMFHQCDNVGATHLSWDEHHHTGPTAVVPQPAVFASVVSGSRDAVHIDLTYHNHSNDMSND